MLLPLLLLLLLLLLIVALLLSYFCSELLKWAYANR